MENTHVLDFSAPVVVITLHLDDEGFQKSNKISYPGRGGGWGFGGGDGVVVGDTFLTFP